MRPLLVFTPRRSVLGRQSYHYMAKNKNNSDANYVLPFEREIVALQRHVDELVNAQAQSGRDYSPEIRNLREDYISLLTKTYANLTAWETVQVARHPQRPLATDYLNLMLKDARQLHGDRCFGDDPSIITALGQIGREKRTDTGQIAPHY